MNNSNYFPHNIDARMDEKLMKVRIRHGAAGYACFFYLLERLAANPNHTEELDYDVLMFDFHVERELIESVINDFGLFVVEEVDGKKYYSPGLKERLFELDTKREKRRKAGLMSGKARAEKADAKKAKDNAENEQSIEQCSNNVQTDSEQSPNNKSRVNKSKRKEIKNKENLSLSLTTPKESADAGTADDKKGADAPRHFSKKVTDEEYFAIVEEYMLECARKPCDEADALIKLMHPGWKGKYDDFSSNKADAVALRPSKAERRYSEVAISLIEKEGVEGFMKVMRAAGMYDKNVLNSFRRLEKIQVEGSDAVRLQITFTSREAVETLEGQIASFGAALRSVFPNMVDLSYRIRPDTVGTME